MTKTAFRLAAGLAVGLLTACNSGNPSGVSNTPHIGGGALPLDALAVTSTDAETGNPSYTAYLRWSPALNAKNYEVYRKFGTNTRQLRATQQEVNHTDSTVGRDQTFEYSIRALSGENMELTASNPVSVTVFAPQVGKPTTLQPADNTVVGIGDVPTLQWDAVNGANWYYVKVNNVADNSVAYSALTQATSIKFGDNSPLNFERFPNLFPVGAKSSIVKGIVYSWTVSAVRGDNTDLAKAKALDVNPSAAMTFRQQ